MTTQPPSILLIGPTGSGKTPLGEAMQIRGIGGKRCFHFDFGEQLRRIDDRSPEAIPVGEKEKAVIRHALATGTLLENRQFAIAATILTGFMKRNNIRGDDWLIMNGLPRHIDQAEDTDQLVDIRLIISLTCTPDIILRRICRNSGGDRTERHDDQRTLITKKLALFKKETEPLIIRYRNREVPVESIPIRTATTSDKIMKQIDRISFNRGDQHTDIGVLQ